MFNSLNWNVVEEQLRAIGITVPDSDQQNKDATFDHKLASALQLQIATDRVREDSQTLSTEIDRGDSAADKCGTSELLRSLRMAGVTFYERVADSQLIVQGGESLSPGLRTALNAGRADIRHALIPAESTASTALLKELGVELIFINDEQRAAEEVLRLCTATDTFGLDIETAPRPEFLPAVWPINVTNDGQRAKAQPVMDTAAALDAFRAEVRLLQVAGEIDGRIVALVIDLRHVPLLSDALAPLWKSKLVGHNLSFDLKMLIANGVDLDGADVVDTILMSGLVLRGVADERRVGSRRPSLKAVVQEARGIELPKASQTSPWWRDELSDEQIAYAALDAVFALQLAQTLQPRIDTLPRGAEALARLNAAVIPVARMELAGITLDREGLREQVDGWEKDRVHLQREIAAIGIANPSSGPQLAAWLRQGLQSLDTETGSRWLTTWPRTESGTLSTKAKHIKRVVDVLPGAELLVRHSALAQLRSNFGEKLLTCISTETGRLHGNFSIAAAKSGRFSSSKPNLQNIPKSEAMRSLFVAAPGKVLVVADYSQLELRVMAAIARDSVMTNAYQQGLDLHAVTAAGMLGIDPGAFDSSNRTHKEARQKAKAVNFGVIYGSGPGGLQEFARDAYGVVMSLDEAQRVIDRFLVTYPGVAQWQKRQADRSRRDRAASTVGGRVYRFAWEPQRAYSRNLALNLPVQGTAAEIALEATIRIDRRLRSELGERADLVLQVHDEFVVEADRDAKTAASVKQVLEEEMSAAFSALLPDMPLAGLVEAYFGPNWAEAKG